MSAPAAESSGYLAGAFELSPRSRLRALQHFARRKPFASFGAAIVLCFAVLAVIGPTVAPYIYDQFDIHATFRSPSAHHLFGTDNQGRDQFSRVLYGARTSIVVGFTATLMATAISTLLGAVSGYFGGLFDVLLQRVLEIWQAFPGLIFVIFIVSVLGSSELNVILTIGLLFTAGTSRVIRSAALSIREQPYIDAATATGAGHSRVLFFHVLPNLLPILIVTASVQVGAVILIESSLSFLGFGVPPPHPTWGGMLQDAQRFVRSYPYLAVFPGAAIALVVYSFNMLGDGLRDVLDPRLRGAR